MDNIIILQFKKTITGLAGYNYGREIFKQQVEGQLNYDGKITLVFPDHIQRLASSFIQGFFEDIVIKIGVSGIKDNVVIQSARSDLKETIINNLM